MARCSGDRQAPKVILAYLLSIANTINSNFKLFSFLLTNFKRNCLITQRHSRADLPFGSAYLLTRILQKQLTYYNAIRFLCQCLYIRFLSRNKILSEFEWRVLIYTFKKVYKSECSFCLAKRWMPEQHLIRCTKANRLIPNKKLFVTRFLTSVFSGLFPK